MYHDHCIALSGVQMSDGKFKVMNPVQSPGFIPTHALLAGPYAASVKGGGGGVIPEVCTVPRAQAHSPLPRGVWGHAPPENFGNLDSLRTFLKHSDSHMGANSSVN